MLSRPRRLTALPADLRERGHVSPPYRVLYDLALDGRFPARQISNIWHYEPADVDQIARDLNLAYADAGVHATS